MSAASSPAGLAAMLENPEPSRPRCGIRVG